MKRYVDAGPLVCRHCGQPVIDGFSRTGLVHEVTRKVRCDGRGTNATGKPTATLAVAS